MRLFQVSLLIIHVLDGLIELKDLALTYECSFARLRLGFQFLNVELVLLKDSFCLLVFDLFGSYHLVRDYALVSELTDLA